jgi:hypothetical protein
MTDQPNSTEKPYTIGYVSSEHWSPELPRVFDSLGNRLAICDDIDAADIILQALTRAPSGNASELAKEFLEKQQDLDPDVAKILYDNLWDLYIKDDTALPSTGRVSISRLDLEVLCDGLEYQLDRGILRTPNRIDTLARAKAALEAANE